MTVKSHGVITGASSGVGQALAVELAASVGQLALVGRDAQRLQATANRVRERGGQALCFTADLSSRAEVDGLATALGAALPRIALLVHSAGVFVSGSIEDCSEADFDRALDVNLRAPYVLTRRLLPTMARDGSDIVLINSSAVGQRRPGLAAYQASKHGLLGMTESLRQEVGDQGVRVLSVFLGATATPMQQDIYAQDERPYNPDALLQPQDVARAIVSMISLPRGAEVTDLHLRPGRRHR